MLISYAIALIGKDFMLSVHDDSVTITFRAHSAYGHATVKSKAEKDSVTGQQAVWLDRATLTGDWAGVRTALEDSGVRLRAGLITESAANPVGGQRQSARYTQEVNLGADLDLSLNSEIMHKSDKE